MAVPAVFAGSATVLGNTLIIRADGGR